MSVWQLLAVSAAGGLLTEALFVWRMFRRLDRLEAAQAQRPLMVGWVSPASNPHHVRVVPKENK